MSNSTINIIKHIISFQLLSQNSNRIFSASDFVNQKIIYLLRTILLTYSLLMHLLF